MKPNKIYRNIALKVSSKKFFITSWVVMSIASLIAGIILEILELASVSIGWIMGFVIVLLLGGILLINVGFIFIYKGVINYKVSENKISKEELIEKALLEDKFTVENNGKWLDFSLNWKNCFSVDVLNPSMTESFAVYKKLIKVKDDYTYEELDYEVEKSSNVSLGKLKISIGYRSFLGHISHHCIEYNIGKDYNTGNVGINKYKLNTLDFTNEVHKWLADNGYKEVR